MLNVGLQAGILSQRVFTIFVVMALVTTFLTTPITTFLYPPWYQRKIEAWRRGEIDWDGNPIASSDDGSPDEKDSLKQPLIQNCMVVLNRMEDLPTMMTVTKLLACAPRHLISPHPTSKDPNPNILKVHCLRLMELTQRTSAVMKVSERHFDRLDPVVNVFRTFGKLNEVLVTARMAIVPDSSFADSVEQQARSSKAEMIIVPWTSHLVPFTGAASIPQDEFITKVLDNVKGHVGVMIDTTLHIDDESPSEPSLSRSISVTSLRNRARATASEIQEITPTSSLQEGYHVFLPYFGGKDDHIALMMVIQLLQCPEVKATVVRIRSVADEASRITSPTSAHFAASKDPLPSTQVINTNKSSSALSSAVSSAIAKVHFPRTPEPAQLPDFDDPETVADENHFTHLLDSISTDIKTRLTIDNITTSTPLQYVVKRAKKEIDTKSTKHNLIIVGRGTKSPPARNLTKILRRDLRDSVKGGQNSEIVGKSCLGDAGEAMLLGHVTGGLLVVQSSMDDTE